MAMQAADVRSCSNIAVPVPPPVRATEALPRAACASTKVVTNREATAAARSCGSACTTSCGAVTVCLWLRLVPVAAWRETA